MPDHQPPARGASLRWRLPLVVCSLVVAVVTVVLSFAHWEIERELLRGARVRLQAVADQMAGLLAQSIRQRIAETARLASHVDVRRALAEPGETARARAISALEAAAGQAIRIEVWTAAGTRVIDLVRPRGEETLPEGGAPPTGTGLSEVKAAGTVAYYETVAAIEGPNGNGPAGYLVMARSISTAPATQIIQGLIGSDAVIRLGNRTGGVWTDLARVVPAPPVPTAAAGVTEYRGSDSEGRLLAATPIGDTPWTVGVEFRRGIVVAPARAFLIRMLVLAVPFVLVALVVTRVLMSRVTTPLVDLTQAAEAIAGGEYSRRVDAARDDEIGRLGEAFNTMTARVEEGVQQLESRVRERTRDVEEAMSALKLAQEQAVRREKLAILGQLASGVGHELRNPLAVMTNAVYYLELIRQEADPEVREYLGIIRGQIGIADRIVTDLLDFARVKPPQRGEVPLDRLVDDQLARLGPLDGIEIRRELPPGLPAAWIDAGQVGQVVLNLLMNAVQAMEERGVLTLRAGASDGTVRLDVCDTGAGIPLDLQQKIFEPLFTTKARGIGLGLAVSRSLAVANGGALAVASRPGEGATFSLTLPAAQGVSA